MKLANYYFNQSCDCQNIPHKENQYMQRLLLYCSISDCVVDIIHLPSVVVISSRQCFSSKKLIRVVSVMINVEVKSEQLSELSCFFVD